MFSFTELIPFPSLYFHNPGFPLVRCPLFSCVPFVEHVLFLGRGPFYHTNSHFQMSSDASQSVEIQTEDSNLLIPIDDIKKILFPFLHSIMKSKISLVNVATVHFRQRETNTMVAKDVMGRFETPTSYFIQFTSEKLTSK